MPNLTNNNRARLLLGCGSAALALSLAIAPERAAAQGIQATPNVTQGAATIDRAVQGQDTIAADTPTVVIDWTPDQDNFGNALDFLPTGNTAIFQNGDNIPSTTFSVLNRILPSTNGNIAVIDGTVISQIIDGNGMATPGGFVAFYSPTGILIGNNAVFDVGSLMLTTLDPDPSVFGAFAGGGSPLNLNGAAGNTAQIIINPGAGIVASPENSFFIAAAAQVQMLGTALVNGSHAYIGGEIVTVTFNNGLFDIQVPVGSASATQITIDGDVGGPSSSGAGDNHIIYAVARAQANPISMLFSGNLGFDPAAVAGVVNGEIILSANFDVSGRTAASGSITDGINAEFLLDAPGAPPANLVVQDIAASSSLLAVSSDTVDVVSQANPSFFDGDLLVAAANLARVSANNGLPINILGDALVYSRDIGVIGMALNDPTAINAAGGTAIIEAVGSAVSISIAGNARVDASAIAGQDLDTLAVGSATGGTAQIDARGGTIDITGFAVVDAQADVTIAVAPLSAGDITGGNANVLSRFGGLLGVGGNLDVLANAFGVDGDTLNTSRGSAAFGGIAGIVAAQGDVSVGGDVLVEATAFAGGSNDLAKGADADAGTAIVIAQNGNAAFAGQVSIDASASGGENQLGEGGDGLGGVARLEADSGATVSVGGDFAALASAEGGDGTSGGNSEGGSAGVRLVDADADLLGAAIADAGAFGGRALFGFGGTGGDALGGAAFLQAEASLVTTASLTIAGDATVAADGIGGAGGLGDGSGVAAGNGGNGTGGNQLVLNQADATLPSGAYILADADNGTVSVGGNTSLSAIGQGGEGGAGGIAQAGGAGGDGTGGDSTVGLINFFGDGSVGLGSAAFGSLAIDVTGQGGEGGFGGSTLEPRGDGGTGAGGFGFLELIAGSISTGQASLVADGRGGDGDNGGDGTGGGAGMGGALQGNGSIAELTASAIGVAGSGESVGGDGFGGDAFIDINDIQIAVAGDVVLDASGIGGFSGNGDGGDGTGGLTGIGALDPSAPGSAVVGGNASIAANGLGGDGGPAFTGGVGQGGSAFVQAFLGSTVSLGSAQVTASGLGGSGDDAGGGAGTGGSAQIFVDGAGSTVTVLDTADASFTDQFNRGGILAANGEGGEATGGSGIGGTGTGGQIDLQADAGGTIALPSDPGATAGTIAANILFARGYGGNSAVDGGSGGSALGGNGNLSADGGSVSAGLSSYSVAAVGGTGADPSLSVDGGDATGGTRAISINNGSTVTLELASGGATAIGGSGSGTGNGGNATGGMNQTTVNDSTLSLVGQSIFVASASGGDGVIGGSASDGTVDFAANSSVINILPDTGGIAEVLIGGKTIGGNGSDQGGDAQGVTANVSLSQTDVVGGSLAIDASARGGDADPAAGIGGQATAGTASLSAVTSGLGLAGRNRILADATGGAGATGGNAAGGTANADLTNSDLIMSADLAPGSLEITSNAVGGSGSPQDGDATAGLSEMLLDNSNFASDQLAIASNASSVGGTAIAGDASAAIDGSSTLAVANLADLSASATGGPGGSASGGEAGFRVGPSGGATATMTALALDASAIGGDTNETGRFFIDVQTGSISVTDLAASALGDAVPAGQLESTLVAEGGDLRISGTGLIDVLDDFVVRTSGGGVVGDPDASTPTSAIDISSQGTITVFGDDENVVALGGDFLALRATELNIEAGARIGAATIEIQSLETVNPAILGGTTEEIGFTLTQTEADRIDANQVFLIFPEVDQANLDAADLTIRNLPVAGSLDAGLTLLDIDVGGITRVEGSLDFAQAAPTDRLVLSATDRIEIVTPGGIHVTAPDGSPGGTLQLISGDIWSADSAMIAQLVADPQFAGRDEDLAVAVTGSDDPGGYITADTVELVVDNSLLVRNTGSTFEQGGITVGIGGLSIRTGGQPDPLDVFAYGRRDAGGGSFITGEAFFDEVNYNFAGVDPTAYLDVAAFNDCIINTGECPTSVPEQPELPVTNPTVTITPVNVPPQVTSTEPERNDRFGPNFPGLISIGAFPRGPQGEPSVNVPDLLVSGILAGGRRAGFALEVPGLSEDPTLPSLPLLDDPVASGGDATLYSGGGASADEGREQ
ncbi:hypothetical protein [Erythrobacter sp. THAF29]|uniref:beta strand repeat-containing protein n=1 Tax=Erythrobacter sp. THAF29 TaxID=2587851 RepID=UPI0012682598|nr:hypothetical protein [Erythrobacter sp. THAF29]QFT78685.1 hypothetical protein FIU90_14135 [Erythrobacter sp. THAF29]